MEVPISYRLQCILACPIRQRCQELTVLMEESTFKDVHVLFPMLVESIFGFRGKPGWGINQFGRTPRTGDFDILRHFLHPEGPLMRLIDKLMTDNHLKYEFPISCLPRPLCHSFEGGMIPPFYSKLIQVQSPGKILPFLSLNPFEFFVFHLAYFLIDSCDPKFSMEWVATGESLYAFVIEDYLHFFLPCDGSFTPAPTYYRTKPSIIASPSLSPTKSWAFHSIGDRLSPLQSLFRKPPEMVEISLSHVQKDVGEDDLWRTEAFVQTLVDFWLNHYIPEGPRNSFTTTPEKINSIFSRNFISSDLARSPDSSMPYSSQLFMSGFFPTTDHIRLVRMLVKHLHYFSNSARLNSTCQFDDFKRAVVPQILKKKLYTFSKYMFDHWPLDASFRQVLEMWLSYIQPWRYIDSYAIRSPSREQLEERDQVVLSKWKHFVEENLAFYSVFFCKMIRRFLRMDLSSARNALMLHRLAKVFSQTNLKPLIKNAEELQTEPLLHATPLSKFSTHHSMLSKSMTAVGHASTIRQHLNDLEGHSFNYVPVFGEEVAAQVLQLLYMTINTKERIHESSKSLKPTNHGRISRFINFIWSLLLFGDDDLDSDSLESNGRRVEHYLEYAVTQLGNLFEFPSQAINSYLKRDLETSRGIRLKGQMQATEFWDSGDESYDNGMTPDELIKMMNPDKKPVLQYNGDPDLQPIRSYESAHLVRLLYQLSSVINDRFGLDIQHLYERTDFVGRLCRQVILPPVFCRSFAHHGTPSPVIEKILPPRITLRSLSNKQLLGYLFAIYGVGWVWGYSFFGMSAMILLFVAIFAISRAVVEPYFNVKR